ncbi:MAG: DUF87 domain-containing protein [Candidatus Bathyarchaeia archaeon]|jgi:DNA helicase HerA-like ATPase
MSSETELAAVTESPSSVNRTIAIVKTNKDLLHRFVSYGEFLGIIVDVFYDLGHSRKRIAIKNLVKRNSSETVEPVRDAPSPDLNVNLASAVDLRKFFPTKPFPNHGYIGTVRGTDYPVPIDLEKLCYRNAAVLAGTGHGKSTLAALLACELYASGKRIVVIDPTGEWKRIVRQLAPSLSIPEGSIKCDVIPPIGDNDTLLYETSRRILIAALRPNSDLFEIVDVSFPDWIGSILAKKKKQRMMAWRIEEDLISQASSHFAETEKTYDFKTCVILEEAHDFVPAKPMHDDQEALTETFAVATKEFRKHGLGHIFIDQSLRTISPELQIQTFLFGSTNAPADLLFLRKQLGEDIASAIQRTSATLTRTWVAFGEATPVPNIPWELEMPNSSRIPELLKTTSQVTQ